METSVKKCNVCPHNTANGREHCERLYCIVTNNYVPPSNTVEEEKTSIEDEL